MRLKTAREQIVNRLIDANVRFDSGDDDLPRADFFEFFDKSVCAARLGPTVPLG